MDPCILYEPSAVVIHIGIETKMQVVTKRNGERGGPRESTLATYSKISHPFLTGYPLVARKPSKSLSIRISVFCT